MFNADNLFKNTGNISTIPSVVQRNGGNQARFRSLYSTTERIRQDSVRCTIQRRESGKILLVVQYNGGNPARFRTLYSTTEGIRQDSDRCTIRRRESGEIPIVEQYDGGNPARFRSLYNTSGGNQIIFHSSYTAMNGKMGIKL